MNLLSRYYTDQAERRSRPSDNPLVFLDYCTVKTAEEDSRARTVLPDTSWDAVQVTTERSLLLGHLDWLANGGEHVSVRTWVPSDESISSVIGQLIEMNDPEKLRTLITVFDRVGGVPKLVNAFKSFVTVSLAFIFSSVVSLHRRSGSAKLYATLLAMRRWLSGYLCSSPMLRSRTHSPYRPLPSPKTSSMLYTMHFLMASKDVTTSLRR